jgi:hypothetical protein
MLDDTYNLPGAQFTFSSFDCLDRDLNYEPWPVTLSLLQETGRILCPPPRTRMRIENFQICHPNFMK